MKLCYVLVNERNELLLEKTPVGFCLPSSGRDVDEGYGFESVDDNLWFQVHCGLKTFRRYLFFCGDVCVAVFELCEGGDPTGNFCWVGDDKVDGSLVSPKERFLIGEALVHYAHSKNAPWVGEAGFRPYVDWVRRVAEEKGLSLTGEMAQVKNSYVSSIFQIPTDAGPLFLKIPAAVYLNDVETVEKFLVDHIYRQPEIVAVSPDHRGFLSKAMPGEDLRGTEETELLERAVAQWAVRQRRLAEDRGEISGLLPLLHDYTAGGVLARLDRLKTGLLSLLERLERPVVEERLEAKLAEAERRLRALAGYRIPDTLCHGDFRPGNVRVIDRTCLLYDWGMSIYAHPFYDLSHFLHVIRRQLQGNQRDRLVNAYLSQWEPLEPRDNLEEAFSAVEQLRDFFMVLADSDWLLELLQASDFSVSPHSMDGWLFTRRAHYFLRVFDRFWGEA